MTTFRVGDLADHKSRELDPRRVAEVDGPLIRLEVGDVGDCWVAAEDYDVLRYRCPACGVNDRGHQPGDEFCLTMQAERRWKNRGE